MGAQAKWVRQGMVAVLPVDVISLFTEREFAGTFSFSYYVLLLFQILNSFLF